MLLGWEGGDEIETRYFFGRREALDIQGYFSTHLIVFFATFRDPFAKRSNSRSLALVCDLLRPVHQYF